MKCEKKDPEAVCVQRCQKFRIELQRLVLRVEWFNVVPDCFLAISFRKSESRTYTENWPSTEMNGRNNSKCPLWTFSSSH